MRNFSLAIILVVAPKIGWSCSLILPPYTDEYYYIKDYQFAALVVSAKIVNVEYESRGGGNLVYDWSANRFEIIEIRKGTSATNYVTIELQHWVTNSGLCSSSYWYFAEDREYLLYLRRLPNGVYFISSHLVLNDSKEDRLEIISKIESGEIVPETSYAHNFLRTYK
ncbi:MAG: hypothetical protein GKR91_12110 [Pseudomonadales bacterium]|nr:hypothetical protein [Pseudomonadales bacterium]